MGATAPAVPCRQGIVPNHPRRLCGSVSVRRCGFPRPVVPRGRASRADCPRSSARSRSPRPIAHALAVASCMPCLCPFRARRGSAHSRCSLIRPPSWRRVSAPPPPCPSRSRRLTVPRVIRPVEPSPPVCERRSWSQSSFGRPRPMWPVRGGLPCRPAPSPRSSVLAVSGVGRVHCRVVVVVPVRAGIPSRTRGRAVSPPVTSGHGRPSRRMAVFCPRLTGPTHRRRRPHAIARHVIMVWPGPYSQARACHGMAPRPTVRRTCVPQLGRERRTG